MSAEQMCVALLCPFSTLNDFSRTQLQRELQSLRLATVDEGDSSRRRDIEGQIALYNHRIAILKQRLNTHLPISRFPPEVLTRIFHQYISFVRKTERDVPGLHGVGRPYRWILVTHVCHSWRQLTLTTPKIWSSIVITRAECVRELLLRAKNAPLSLKADLCKNVSVQLLTKEVLSHLDRIVDIDLQVPGPQALIELDHGSRFASSLRSLIISTVDEAILETPSPLPFLNAQARNLQRLSYTSPIFTWNQAIVCPTLRSLVIINTKLVIPEVTASVPTIAGMLVALQRLVLLEELKLEGVFAHMLDVPEDQINVFAELPHLKLFRFVGVASTCSHLLKFMRVPEDAILELECILIKPLDFRNIIEVAISAQALPFQTRPGFPIRSMSAASSSTGNFRVQTWLDVHSLTAFSRSIAPPPSLDIIVRGPPELIHPSMLAACTYLPLSQVQTMSVERDWFSPEDHTLWREGAQMVPHLRGLRVSGGVGNCIPFALGQAGNRETPVPLPHLRALMLENLDVKAEELDYGGDFLGRLRNSLWERRQSGFGIKQLLLKVCMNLHVGDELQLQAVVDELKWDRSEFTTTESSQGRGAVRWFDVKEEIEDKLEDYLDD